MDGLCRCHEGWRGAACDSLRCEPQFCGRHGVCTAGTCGLCFHCSVLVLALGLDQVLGLGLDQVLSELQVVAPVMQDGEESTAAKVITGVC